MQRMTKSPTLFISYLLIFSLVIVLLTINTSVDIINTYQVTICNISSKYYVMSDNILKLYSDKGYLYTDKNKDIYEIHSDNIIYDSTNDYYEIIANDSKLSDFLAENSDKEIKIDIPKGQTTLFNRIFLKGGKS